MVKNNDEEEKAYPEEEQGIEPEETPEEEKLDIELGKKNEDLDTEAGREEVLDEEGINPTEEGVMEGYEAGEGEHLSVCDHCGRILKGPEGIVEAEYDEKMYRFCSDKCAGKFEENRQ